MRHSAVLLVLAGSLVGTGCATHDARETAPAKAPQYAAMPRATPQPQEEASAPADPPSVDAETHAKYSLAVGGGPSSAIDPASKTIPSPPATIDVRPDSGVDAAIKLVPTQIPVGHLSRVTLEGPLKDPLRFARCAIPLTTRVAIRAVVYNGQAIGVDVRSNPNTPPLDFCVDRIVRQTTWIKELAINRVNVTL